MRSRDRDLPAGDGAYARMTRATIKDVSRVAGVSIKTVSRVLNKERYVSDDMRQKVEEAVARLNYHPSLAARTLAGDELRLSQVVTNLMSNAVKFTPEGGAVTLKVHEVQKDAAGSLLRFSVSDTGIGMTEEQTGKLFSAFEQVDGSITRRFGGTGLGLALSKRLAELMHGVIRVESAKGKGSTFAVELPLVREEQA